MKITPVIKWAGGKTQLLPLLTQFCNIKFDVYIEPFLGGGALFFHLVSVGILTKNHSIIISDINYDLINLYKCIREDCDKVIDNIKEFCGKEECDNDKYTENRDLFNKLRNKKDSASLDFKLAALFIWINKSCFNGLYRLNKSGGFNVPWGKRTYKISKSEIENIRNISSVFNEYKVEIKQGSYLDYLDEKYCGNLEKKKEYLVYLDPPYYPVKSTSFTQYDNTKFDFKEYFKVVNNTEHLNLLTSNSNCKPVIEGLDKHIINYVSAKKMINSNGKDRKDQKEVITVNYIGF